MIDDQAWLIRNLIRIKNKLKKTKHDWNNRTELIDKVTDYVKNNP